MYPKSAYVMYMNNVSKSACVMYMIYVQKLDSGTNNKLSTCACALILIVVLFNKNYVFHFTNKYFHL